MTKVPVEQCHYKRRRGNKECPDSCVCIARIVTGIPVSVQMILRNPLHRATEEDVAKRKGVCESCPANQGITQRLSTLFVKCRECTTCEKGRNITAKRQRCPINKW